MKRNYKVDGSVAFYMNYELHSVLTFETLHQRRQILDDFFEKIKHIRQRSVIYYVISIDENSLPTHGKKKVRIPKASRLQIENKNGIYTP